MLFYCGLIFGSMALSLFTGNGEIMTAGFFAAYIAFFYQVFVQKNKQAMAVLGANIIGLAICTVICLVSVVFAMGLKLLA